MDEVTQRVLAKIYEATKNTIDGYTVGVSIGIRSDSRREVCSWLVDHGYITKVTFVGQDKIQCQITEKTKHYFADFL